MSAVEALRELVGDVVRQLFPAAAVPWGPYRYRVDSVDTSTGRLVLVPVVPGGAPQKLVEVWAGIPGSVGAPRVGSSVLLVFADGDTPCVVAFHPLRLTGGTPTAIKLDADAVNLGAAAGVVPRFGDTVTVGVATGVLTLVSGTAETPAAPSKVKA